MLYFSELLRKKIYTEDRIFVGRLKDIIFLATEQPNITKIVVAIKQKHSVIVSLSFLKKINSDVILSKNYETCDLELNELYVAKNLLDKQIIDIKGNKIVRVNDVAIQDKPSFYIAGVDIGVLGIMRWLHVEDMIVKFCNNIGIKITSRFLSWGDIQPIELARGRVKLKKEDARLEKMRPADLADYLERTNIFNVKRILRLLKEEFAADVIAKMNVNYQTALFKHFSPEKAVKVISFIDPDEAVDILLALSARRREQIIELLPEKNKSEITYLLHLSKTPIGELITSEFFTASSTDTVDVIIRKIRAETADFSSLEYVYVVNEQKQLVGVFSLRELLMQDSATTLYKFMIQNVVVIHLTTPREIAMKKMLKYGLQAIPVIDDNKSVLGIVVFTDLAKTALKHS
ncbi:CBS domain-containing protein [Candidatus Roizmanbacteria bacterium]|nr:CBS domain-containing protein [Candidatus Roizmanbacteria bacterium]